MSKLIILTLTWNRSDLITKLKESLIPALSEIDRSWEWWIKDNASQDNTIPIIKSWGLDKIKLIAYENNLQNYAEGNNLLFDAAAPADDDYILLLNNDIIFRDSQSIPKMINIMEKDKDVGVVGARLLYTGTNLIQHCGVVISNLHKLPMHFRSGQKTDLNDKKNRLFQSITGACLLTKAEYYKNICTTNKFGVKGLNQDQVWAFDDIDACLSIKYNMGKKIVYCGETNIFHEESVSLKKKPTNKLYSKHNVQTFNKNWGSRIILDEEFYVKDNNFNLYR
jgi:hypothetical protein